MENQTKALEQLAAELDSLRRANAALQQQLSKDDAPAVKRRLAVERMRAEAMAMGSSEDLLKLIGLMCEEIINLGIATRGASIRFVEADGSRVTSSYYAIPNPKRDGIPWTSPDLYEYSDELAVGQLNTASPRDQAIIDAWRQGATISVEGTLEDYAARLNRMVEAWGLERPISIPDEKEWTFNYVPFEHGVISFLEHRVDPEQQSIVGDLAAALSLGYIRYLDFQRLEQQNKKLSQANADLSLEAALERVRAKALGMQKSEDLVEVGNILFEEYESQGFPLVRSSITIWDEATDLWQAWVTRKIEASSTAYKLSLKEVFKNLEFYREGFAAWKRGEPNHIVEMRGKDRTNYFSTLKVFLNRSDQWLEGRLATMPDPYLQYLVFFSHGYLEINQGPVIEKANLQTAKRFADVFDIAYQRYVELQQAEAARVQLEQQNKALEENLRLLRETQNQLLIQEKMASLGDLVAGVAHEMNTPLGSIRSMHHTLVRAIDKVQQRLDQTPPGEIRQDRTLQSMFKVIAEANKVIDNGSSRVDNIVTSLRNFARLDEAEFQVVDIHVGIDSALTLLGSQLEGKIAVTKDYGDIPPIHCAPGQLNQVFMHLLKNAIQAMGDTGRITITTFTAEDKVGIRFSDTGAGMAPQQVARLFDFDFNTADNRVKMGFGLATDFRIIQEHKGQIQAESQLDKGTQMTILLPVGT